ncbi:prolyl oligopeptidase family serine peptidase [Streptomyces brevispora]|uniref:prolyl oligopeptidase family serine peptidase n=1 Tax=Streptomyces brevispora TaxID=887462 RepID=UPI003404F1E3
MGTGLSLPLLHLRPRGAGRRPTPADPSGRQRGHHQGPDQLARWHLRPLPAPRRQHGRSARRGRTHRRGRTPGGRTRRRQGLGRASPGHPATPARRGDRHRPHRGRPRWPTRGRAGPASGRRPAGGIHFHRALRHFGVEHEFVVYPREGHGLHERTHQLDSLRRIRAWYDRWL